MTMTGEKAIQVEAEEPSVALPAREKHGSKRLAKAALILGLGGLAGGAIGVVATHNHDVKTERGLEAQKNLEMQLLNHGIKQVYGVTTDSEGHPEVILSTRPGQSDNQLLHFRVVEKPRFELIDGQKELTTNEVMDKYVVTDHTSEEIAIKGLESRS